MSDFILLRHRDIPDINKLDVYQENGGFEAFKQVVMGMKPEEVTDVVKASGLRGRGGAGFPTGVKWSFMDNKNWPHYVVANADESEPGTFKDREIMESNPFQFIEGVAIACYAVGAESAYIYCRGEFWQVAHFLDEKIAEAEQAGLLGENLFGTDYSLKIHTHLGAGAYICGEETALLESLEGKRGQPRLRPPFPPSFGLYGKPTVVNNVETLTNVPPIITQGADWYNAMGTDDTAGVKIFSLSGRVEESWQLRTSLWHHLPRIDLRVRRWYHRRSPRQSDHGSRCFISRYCCHRRGSRYPHGLRIGPHPQR